MEILLEFLAEFLIQVGSEAILEFGFHSLRDTFKRKRNPYLSTVGFVLWGTLAGGFSLWPFPHSFIARHDLRLLNLFVTPLAAGSVMFFVGRIRTRRGDDLVGLDRFGYALVFALSMALLRFAFAK